MAQKKYNATLGQITFKEIEQLASTSTFSDVVEVLEMIQDRIDSENQAFNYQTERRLKR